jgi:hypothetical protein
MFFINAATNIIKDINPFSGPGFVFPNYNGPKLNFSQFPVSPSEIQEIIENLKSKSSSDSTGVSSAFIQNFSLTLSVPLSKIFCSSLETGCVPKQLKIAKVIPLFKSGEKETLDNYRPISLLNVFSKVLEKIVCNRLTTHLEINSILSSSQ